MWIFWKLLLTLLKGTDLSEFGFKSKKKRKLQSRMALSAGTGGKLLQIILSLGVIGYMGFMGYNTGLLFVDAPDVAKSMGLGFIVNNVTVAILFVITMINFMSGAASLFFAKDTETLIVMPIKPTAIVMAKLAHTYILSAFWISVLILLPYLGVAGFILGMPFHYYIGLVLIVTLASAIPICLTTIITMVLMRFSKWARNKDRYTLITQIMMMATFFGIYFYMLFGAKGSAPDAFANTFSSNEGFLSTVGRAISWMSTFMVNPLTLENTIFALCFVGICLVFVLILAIVANTFYLRIVMFSGDNTSKRRQLNAKEITAVSKKSSVAKSLVRNEWRTVRRAPAFALNILGSVVIQTVMLIFFAAITIVAVPGGFTALREGIDALSKLSYEVWGFYYVMGIIVLAFFTAAQCGATCVTALSREGKGAYMLKVLPIKPLTFFLIKLRFAFSLNIIPLALLLIGTRIVVTIPWIIYIPAVVFSLIALLFSTMLGICIDFCMPKLNWDNEQQAVKQNVNLFIQMVINWAFAGALGYAIYRHAMYGPIAYTTSLAIIGGVLVVLLLAVIVLVKPSLRRGFAQIT